MSDDEQQEVEVSQPERKLPPDRVILPKGQPKREVPDHIAYPLRNHKPTPYHVPTDQEAIPSGVVDSTKNLR